MNNEVFYTIPTRTERLGRSGSMPKSNLIESIKQNIKMILTTPPLRSRFDSFYGCKIQRLRFLAANKAMEGTSDENIFKKSIRENITHLLHKYEKRIDLDQVEVSLTYQTDDDNTKYAHQNQAILVKVSVKGKVKKLFAIDKPIEINENISLI